MHEQIPDSKDRILQAAEDLFSEKGFDGTRVNEIAARAGVNKALIYYYFKSKEEILQSLMNALVEDMKQAAIEAITRDEYKMFEEGEAKFTHLDEATIDRYLEMALRQMIDFCLDRKQVFRIVMMESLKKGVWQSLIFRIVDLMDDASITAVFEGKGIALEVDKQQMVDAFFVRLMPLVSFAVYYDEWQAAHQMTGEALTSAFIRSFKPIYYRSLRPVLK